MHEPNPVTELKFRLNGQIKTVSGRLAWMLDVLVKRSHRGVTAADYAGTRMSHYVMKLRREGIDIETQDEGHAGAYAGTHARYVLRSYVEVLSERRQHDGRAAA